jgi:hypothetical protein
MLLCYLCSHCAFTINDLLLHLTEIHALNSASIYKCSYCVRKTFNNKSTFKKHLLTQHREFEENTNINENIQSRNTQSDHSILDASFVFEETIETGETNNTFALENFGEIDSENSNLEKSYNKLTIEEFEQHIEKSALKICLSLVEKNNIPRETAFKVIEMFQDALFKELKKYILDVFETKVSPDSIADLKKFAQILSNPFKKVETEHKLTKELKEMGVFESPTRFTINESVDISQKNGLPKIEYITSNGYLMPIEFQLKTFFEKPQVFETTMKNKQLLEQGQLSHFINGQLWKNKIENMQNKIVFPYFLYNDDFTINTDSSPHATDQKLSGFYYSIPILPIEWLSSLKKIFVAMIFEAKLNSEFGNQSCLTELTDVVKKLELNGITINVDGSEYQVYFVLGLILGDNLGLNCILGFARSFSAIFFCRFCKMQLSETQHSCVENKLLQRTILNYQVDVELNDFAKTGVREESILNTIPSFHVVENFAVDIMHDMFEGVCHRDVILILNYLLKNSNITLQTINSRKQHFEYGYIHTGNRSVPISPHHLKTKKLKMTSSEMSTFIHFLPLILGDLVEPGKLWDFVICLNKMIDILMSQNLSEELIITFNSLVFEHHQTVVHFFKRNLIRKDHHLTHYANIIRMSGPVKHLWCTRFEAKHREFTVYCSSIQSRRNISFSVALKACFKFSHLLLYDDDFKPPEFKFLNLKLENVSYFPSIRNLSPVANQLEKVKQLKEITHKGTLYRPSFYLFQESESEKEMLLFKIMSVLEVENKIWLILKSMRVLGYLKHYNAFKVGEELEEFCVKTLESFDFPPVELKNLSNGLGKVFKTINF